MDYNFRQDLKSTSLDFLIFPTLTSVACEQTWKINCWLDKPAEQLQGNEIWRKAGRKHCYELTCSLPLSPSSAKVPRLTAKGKKFASSRAADVGRRSMQVNAQLRSELNCNSSPAVKHPPCQRPENTSGQQSGEDRKGYRRPHDKQLALFSAPPPRPLLGLYVIFTLVESCKISGCDCSQNLKISRKKAAASVLRHFPNVKHHSGTLVGIGCRWCLILFEVRRKYHREYQKNACTVDIQKRKAVSYNRSTLHIKKLIERQHRWSEMSDNLQQFENYDNTIEVIVVGLRIVTENECSSPQRMFSTTAISGLDDWFGYDLKNARDLLFSGT